MLKTLKSAFVALALVTVVPAAASAETLFSLYPDTCEIGRGGEGVAAVGNGYIAFTEAVYERISTVQPAGDGFSTALYAVMMEGEKVGEERLRFKITDAAFEAFGEEGPNDHLIFKRCP